MALWHIEMLGDFRAVSMNRTVTRFRTHKTACLLALLAYARDRGHPREVLMESLWPQGDPDLSRHNLRMALSSLRHQLEPPGVAEGSVLVSDRQCVRLNPDAVTTDVAVFEEALTNARRAANSEDRQGWLLRAVGLYRGELLPGFYEGWMVREQDRLYTLYAEAVCELVDLLLASDEPADARRIAQTALALYPASQRLQNVLTRPLLRDGTAGSVGLSPIRRGRLAEEPGPVPQLRERSKPDAPVSSLPPALTRFFGREEEMAQLRRLLSDGERLLTITGPGGMGKTRLALETARTQEKAYDGAVWFVPLAGITDPTLIPEAIRTSMGLPALADTDALEQIALVLSRKPALLVLDNYEHLLEGGAEVVQNLLLRIPAIALMVTSRHVLNLSAEAVFPVSPLPVPDDLSEPESLLQCQSVLLFVDRAQRIRPDFQVTSANAEMLACICVRLEGIPLSLELAAARCAISPPSRMLSELEHRFDVLVSRHRDAEPRHQSLRTAIEWSYQLLSPDLQAIFRRLSVFRGGWVEGAAAAVCEDPGAAQCLEELLEASLVLAEETDQGVRFRILETLREFGDEQMGESEQWEVRRLHRDHFLNLTQQAGPELPGAKQSEWFAHLEAEHDNIRAALAFCSEDPEGAEPGMMLAGTMGAFWTWRGYVREGWEHLRRALAHPNASTRSNGWAMAMVGAAHLGWCAFDLRVTNRDNLEQAVGILRRTGPVWALVWALLEFRDRFTASDVPAIRSICEEALALARENGLTAFTIRALDALAQTELLEVKDVHDAASQDHKSACLALFNEALEAARQSGNTHLQGSLLCSLASLMDVGGDVAHVREYLEEALSISKGLGNIHFRPWVLVHYANFLRGTGDYESAEMHFRDAEAICRSAGNPGLLGMALDGLGNMAREQGDYPTARRYYEELIALTDPIFPRGEAYTLHNLGRLTATEGDVEAGRALLLQALALNRKNGNQLMEANNLLILGRIAHRAGDLTDAHQLLTECLSYWRITSDRYLIAYALEAFACLAVSEGQAYRAARLYGEAEAIREAIHKVMQPEDRPEHDVSIARARDVMGEEDFEKAWAEGRSMSLEGAIAFAMGESDGHPGRDEASTL